MMFCGSSPSSSASICAQVVSWPWPCDFAPVRNNLIENNCLVNLGDANIFVGFVPPAPGVMILTAGDTEVFGNIKQGYVDPVEDKTVAVGELVDSALFYFIAFYGIWTTADVIKITIAQYLLKTGWEIVMTPVTYRIVGFLKRVEHEDYYDRHTNFTPFRVRV